MRLSSFKLSEFLTDIRYALRLAGKNPAFLSLTAMSLALSIGANTAVFSVAKQLLYQRLAVPHPEQLRLLGWRGDASVVRFGYGFGHVAGMTSDGFSYTVFRGLRDRDRSMSGLFAYWDQPATASIAGNPQQLRVEFVSDNYYQVLGVRPQLGRPIVATDDKPGASVAVIGDALWERQFGRSSSALGQTILVNHIAVTIVGINPRDFTGAQSTLRSPDLFVPLSMQPLIEPWMPAAQSILSDPLTWMFNVMGRIPPGKSENQVRAALNAELAAAVRSSLTVQPYESVPQLVMIDGSRGLHLWDQTFKTPVTALFVLAALVLLLACANIATLELARTIARNREIAVRVAVGANRGRIVRQLLTESLVLAIIGGSGGLLLGFLVRNLLPRLLASSGPQSALRIHFDWTVWLFSAVVTLLTGFLFGLAPSLSAAFGRNCAGLQQSVVGSPRSRTRGGKALVVVQIALSTLLVMGAGLFVRTLADLNAIDVGFPTGHLLLATIDTPREGYPGARSILLHQRLLEALAVLPGVEAATSMGDSFFGGSSGSTPFVTKSDLAHPGRAENQLVIEVGPGFFSTMGIPLLAGRTFSPADGASTPPVAIINETLAKSRFPGQNPVGQRFTFSYNPGPKDWTEIVGVVRATRFQDLRQAPPPMYFVPTAQGGTIYSMTYALRSRLDPSILMPELRHAVASVDPNLPIADIRTQRQEIEENTRSERALADLTSGFGVLALALAVVGIYGVMLCSVEQRRKDIGIRLALGAQSRRVRNTILRESAWLALVGICAGFAVSQAFTRLLQSILYGITPRDPLVLSSAGVVLLLVALAAAWIPARRAASVEPMEVLRHE
jgi:predicted permease